jgi:DNA sulfur modification protein DndB
MKTSTLLPSIRSCVGDWNYYVTTLTFDEVSRLVKSPDEVHERKRLAEWIQREAIEAHSGAIAQYIANNPQRFLGSLIVGVYGGSPDWTPIKVKIANSADISDEQMERVEGCLGLLQLSGGEKLFAIDGQHRVAGIKLVIEKAAQDDPIRNDSVSAIFVGHDPDSETGKQRTRRLFTTVNKKAKIISKAAKIALDEDDGFAIVTRRLIDNHWLFEDERKYILYGSGGSIPATDETALTSVVGLSEIVKDLYGSNKNFDQERPNDESLQVHFDLCVSFLDQLLEQSPEYKSVFKEAKAIPGYYRKGENNHLLFRPAGQRVFARAVQLLLSRQEEIGSAIGKLLAADMRIQHDDWHQILWDPVSGTMITNKLVIAEAQLLTLAKLSLRNKASGQKLKALLESKAKQA